MNLAFRTSPRALAPRALRTLARRLFLDRQAEFWLGELDAAWSLGEARARIERIITETRDTKTFVLAPNARWRDHRAGQFTTVDVVIDGARHRRCYSLSSAPGDARPTITVKKTRGGKVSTFLHDRARPGDVIALGAPAGDFVLPDAVPPRLLLLSGGSGITPVMSILRDLAARGAIADVVMLHAARSKDDVIFRRELAALALRHAGLRLALATDDDGGRLDEARLRRLVPDFAARDTFLCGPAPMMDWATRLWEAEGAAARLRQERFSPPAPAVAGGEAQLVAPLVTPLVTRLVTLARSKKTLPAAPAATLLAELERAGERPAHGCRMGICQTCKCRKVSGTVQNLLTGAVSSAPDEDINLCVSTACSDVELAL